MTGKTVSNNGRIDQAKLLYGKVLSMRFTRKTILYIEICYALWVNYAVSVLGVPYMALYGLDVLNVACFLLSLGHIKNSFSKLGYAPIITVFLVFCSILVISDVFNLVPIALIVWAFRNTFRFFLFFISCVSLLSIDDLQRFFRMLMPIQVINIILSLYEYFVLGMSQDNLGGIFGIGSGCNGYSNVLFLILLCYYGIQCLSGKQSMWKLVFISVSTLCLAGMAELKFYYFEFIFVIAICCICYLSKVRAFVMTAFAFIALLLGFYVFSLIFPESASQLFDFSEIVQYSTKGMAGYELSRFGAFSEISHLVFSDDLKNCLFGIGFGNAEFSSTISAFTSAFYNIWGFLNYRWFTHQMMFIETGYLGFILFVLIFLMHFIFTLRQMKRFPGHNDLYGFVALFTILTIANFWYNCAVRVESGYLIYLVLSFSCIYSCVLGSESKCL